MSETAAGAAGMSAGDVSGASRPSRLLTLSALVAWTVIAFALPLLALTLNALQLAGFPLGFWFTAQGALIALAALAWIFVARAKGQRASEGLIRPAVFAGEVIGSAGFIAYAGLIALVGYDALSFPLGVAAGLTLMTIVVAPRFVLYPVSTMAGFFTARFGGLWPRRLMLAILFVATLHLLAADIRGAGLALTALTGLDPARSLAAIAATLSLAWFGLELAGRRRRWGVVFVLLLGVLAAVLISFTLLQGRLPLPYFSYGLALKDVADIEIALIGRKLADVRAIKPMTSAFLQFSMWNFAGITLAVALGIAALPQLAGRHLSQATVTPGEAPRRVALALTLIAVFLCGLAPFAVFTRLGVAQLVQSGVPVSGLPDSVTKASEAGWLSVCGAQSASASIIAAACAQTSGHKGQLRLQDMVFDDDAYVFAASRIVGLPPELWLLLVAGTLLAALVAGHALLSGFVAADAEARTTGPIEARKLDLRSVALGIVLLLGAVLHAAVSLSGIATLAADGLALIASSIFPVALLGLYWRRFNASGAVAALAVGFGVCAVYLFGVRLFPVNFFELTGHLSNASPGAVMKYTQLKALAQAAVDPTQHAKAVATLLEHAGGIANWWGLKPPAAVLLAAPAALLSGFLTSVLTNRPRPAR